MKTDLRSALRSALWLVIGRMKEVWRVIVCVIKVPIVGVIIGGLITWGCSYCYYVKASKDLTKATKDLLRIRHIEETGLKILENKGIVKLNRDAQGNIVGVVVKLGANVNGTFALPPVEPEVKHGE